MEQSGENQEAKEGAEPARVAWEGFAAVVCVFALTFMPGYGRSGPITVAHALMETGVFFALMIAGAVLGGLGMLKGTWTQRGVALGACVVGVVVFWQLVGVVRYLAYLD